MGLNHGGADLTIPPGPHMLTSLQSPLVGAAIRDCEKSGSLAYSMISSEPERVLPQPLPLFVIHCRASDVMPC